MNRLSHGIAVQAMACCLWTLGAEAAEDLFYLGNGHSGPLSVTSGTVTVNLAKPVAAALASGALRVSLSDATGFSEGDLILLLQSRTNAADVDPASTSPVDLTSKELGRWELARVTGISGADLLLELPLSSSFPAVRTQVIRVPEFTTVTVSPGATLTATAWDGQSGGVLAFLATQVVTVNGSAMATALGFPAGTSVFDATNAGCVDPNEASPRGAYKGGGALGNSGSAFTGSVAMLNGGGGGICRNSGGGGGGNGGAGGQGGYSDAFDGSRDVGGRGGAAFQFAPTERLLFGGGGGAAHMDETQDARGGVGGGVVFIRAFSLEGGGFIEANGGAANNTTGAGVGSGGGGAGGTVLVQLAATADCGQIRATGGAGGSSLTATTLVGPGGGGGGGRVLLQAADLASCATVVTSGLAGTAVGSNFGATPVTGNAAGFVGQVTSVPSAYSPPPLSPPGSGPVANVRPLFYRVGFGCDATGEMTGLGFVFLVAFWFKRRLANTR